VFSCNFVEFFTSFNSIHCSHTHKCCGIILRELIFSSLSLKSIVTMLLCLSSQVRDVRLIMDRNSRRSKGVGYVSSSYMTQARIHLG
jgi:hypothetical protein